MSLAQKITLAFQAVGADIKALTTSLANKLDNTDAFVSGTLAVNNLMARTQSYPTRILEDVSGIVNLDIGTYSHFEITTTGDIALSINNAPSLNDRTLVFNVLVFAPPASVLDITYFSTILWLTDNELPPANLGQNKIMELEFTTKNGTLFYGRVKSKT